jgi:hypothetical protein
MQSDVLVSEFAFKCKLYRYSAVCLADFVIGDQLTRLPPCGHLFHGACLLPWLKAGLCTG